MITTTAGGFFGMGRTGWDKASTTRFCPWKNHQTNSRSFSFAPYIFTGREGFEFSSLWVSNFQVFCFFFLLCDDSCFCIFTSAVHLLQHKRTHIQILFSTVSNQIYSLQTLATAAVTPATATTDRQTDRQTLGNSYKKIQGRATKKKTMSHCIVQLFFPSL